MKNPWLNNLKKNKDNLFNFIFMVLKTLNRKCSSVKKWNTKYFPGYNKLIKLIL